MTFPPFLLLWFRESGFGCPSSARVIFAEELGTISKNNLRGITLVRGPIWGIHSLTLHDNLLPQTHFDNIATFSLSVLSSGIKAFHGKNGKTMARCTTGKTVPQYYEQRVGNMWRKPGYLCISGTRLANVVPPRDMVFISTCLMCSGRSVSPLQAGWILELLNSSCCPLLVSMK